MNKFTTACGTESLLLSQQGSHKSVHTVFYVGSILILSLHLLLRIPNELGARGGAVG